MMCLKMMAMFRGIDAVLATFRARGAATSVTSGTAGISATFEMAGTTETVEMLETVVAAGTSEKVGKGRARWFVAQSDSRRRLPVRRGVFLCA